MPYRAHVKDAAAAYDDRPGLNGVIARPRDEPEPSFRFRDRTISFHIDEAL